MTVAEHPSTVPGAMETTLRRELPDGTVIDFESAPAGWLTKAGEVRQKDWRAYYVRLPGEGKRVRLPAVSTILDAICPKGGLPWWAEARGIEGAVEAVRLGLVDPEQCDDPVGVVRANGLGADRARDTAAERGLNVHDCLRVYAETGSPPNPKDHPVEHHGYLQGLVRWLLKADPEPVAVETLVASLEDGYAGRLDLRARMYGALHTVEAKTQENGGLYPASHLQCAAYERAARACGDEPADRLTTVVFDAYGGFDEMPADHDRGLLDSALTFYRRIAPLNSMCDARNRHIREAIKEIT